MKAQGAQSLRCRKALSKIIRKHEKAFANFEKIAMKLFLNFIFQLKYVSYLMIMYYDYDYEGIKVFWNIIK